MDYELYLKYDVDMNLNIDDNMLETSEHIFASIMHETDEAVENADEFEVERTKIGFIQLLRYNQVLAMAYDVNMNQDSFISMRIGKEALMELDYTRITQETIDEVGIASNPNILVIDRFGISAAWRNKGIGEQVLKGLIKQMKGKYGYIVITEPKPAQFEEHEVCRRFYNVQGIEMAGLESDPEKAQLKLNSFFQRCGFRLFKNYDNIFISNTDQAVPLCGMMHSDV